MGRFWLVVGPLLTVALAVHAEEAELDRADTSNAIGSLRDDAQNDVEQWVGVDDDDDVEPFVDADATTIDLVVNPINDEDPVSSINDPADLAPAEATAVSPSGGGAVIEHVDIDDTTVSAGIEHSCAIHSVSTVDFGGKVVCWGDNTFGQSSPPDAGDKTVVCWGMTEGVTNVPKGVAFDELTLGWDHGCGILSRTGRVQCWGHNSNGRLDVPAKLYG
ncbi:hypothetical protein DYB37_002205 [Aphanomyces astaci]|uniref:non-specific serine/threonine protein kinase n=1 Tax=Aphanomyces astaci TaxID=112090 RepID=A0A3R6X198_APHAT|nr:hypothetical protein DYB35_007857 [Aphanomyces astaci]RHZ06311.1 hypothetical protein DYB37_002205 [Aphanomyces astaci]